MSEDNTTVAVTETDTQKTRGERGEVGVTTPALTLKARWHAEHFKLVDTSNNAHRNRQSYVAKPGAPSLKAYARQLVKNDDEVADAWLGNKSGENSQKRSEKNAQLAKTCAGATKMGRKKSKGGGGKAKPADAATK
jgi:hypothetical protein